MLDILPQEANPPRPQTPRTVIAEERLRRIFGDPDGQIHVALVATPDSARRFDDIRAASDGSRRFIAVIITTPEQVPAIKDGGTAGDFLYEIAAKVREDSITARVLAYDGRTWTPKPSGRETWTIWNPDFDFSAIETAALKGDPL